MSVIRVTVTHANALLCCFGLNTESDDEIELVARQIGRSISKEIKLFSDALSKNPEPDDFQWGEQLYSIRLETHNR